MFYLFKNINSSDAILNISSLTVFKQEAPSPTHDVGNLHQGRQHSIHNTTNQNNHINSNENITDEANTNQILNSSIHQLLGQNAYSNLQNIDGKYSIYK